MYVQLTTDQLKTLATLADRWLAASPTERDALSAEATALGADFERAFSVMTRQLNADNSATLLPPISDSLRNAAISGAKTTSAGARDLDTAPPQRQSGQSVGPYRLIKEIGRGGMGVVWLAARADGQHERQVALKMPLVENLNWLLAARFARERNILASLEHPGIARLYDAGVDSETQPYIALEYVVGVPINEYVREQNLKPEATVALFTKVIDAVSHAHAQLVIHRDIKPTNILVDGKGEPHLLDFGIAKLLDDEDSMSADATQLTRLSGRALTLDYASPEQVNGQTLGTASDVYSLGVVLYELLTGNKPYSPKGPTRRDLELAIVEQEPTKPSDRLMLTGTSVAGKTARRIRGDLDTVVLKALKKDPRQRYATAQAFADDLKRYLAFEPITAKADSEWYRVTKFIRRNRLSVAMTGAFLAALLVGIVSTIWQAQRAVAATKIAEAERARALEELGNAESTNDMMDFLLGSVSDKPFTLAELLRRAETVADTKYASLPAIRASVQHVIARRWATIGDPARAEALALRAREAARLGSALAEGFSIECFIGAMETARGDGAKARARFDATIAEIGGRELGSLRICLHQRSFLNTTEGRPREALADATEALRLMGTPRPGQIDMALALREARADALAALGQLGEAIAEYDAVIVALTRLARHEHANATVTLNNFGVVLMRAGQIKRAAEILGEAVRVNLLSGTDSPYVPAQTNFGRALMEQGKYDAALVHLQQALSNTRQLGSRSIGFVSIYTAQALCRNSDLPKCDLLLHDGVTHLKSALPPTHLAFSTVLMIDGELHGLRAENIKARESYQQSLAIAAAAPGGEPSRILALSRIAMLDALGGHCDAALAGAGEAVGLARGAYKDFAASDRLGIALSALGRAHECKGDAATSRRAYAEAQTQLETSVGRDTPEERAVRQKLEAK